MTATLIDIPAFWPHAGIMTLGRELTDADDGDPACLKPRGVPAAPALLNLQPSWRSQRIPPCRLSRQPRLSNSEGEPRFHAARSSIFTMMIQRMAHCSDTPWLHERCAALHRSLAKVIPARHTTRSPATIEDVISPSPIPAAAAEKRSGLRLPSPRSASDC
jgi:hypothetical protein